MGILDKIKEESKKSGQSKGKFIYFRENEKKRIRFLCDLNEGMEIIFHDSFEKGVNVPCQEQYGRDCEYCEDEDLRTRSLFAWTVWDYEAKEVKILMQAVNNCTAVPALMALYEMYGTLLDRDLVITKTGKQQNTTYSVVPMDKNKFRNDKAKALSEKAILKNIDKAYPSGNSNDEDEDDEDYSPAKYKKEKSKKEKTKKSKVKEDDYDDELPWDDEEESSDSYEDMSAKELYKLCKEREIECKPKKPEKYYINLLKEDDKQHDDWEDDDEEWEDED